MWVLSRLRRNKTRPISNEQTDTITHAEVPEDIRENYLTTMYKVSKSIEQKTSKLTVMEQLELDEFVGFKSIMAEERRMSIMCKDVKEYEVLANALLEKLEKAQLGLNTVDEDDIYEEIVSVDDTVHSAPNEEIEEHFAIELQKVARGYICRSEFKESKRAAQTIIRGVRDNARKRQLRKSIAKIQSVARLRIVQSSIIREKVIKVQSAVRRHQSLNTYRKIIAKNTAIKEEEEAGRIYQTLLIKRSCRDWKIMISKRKQLRIVFESCRRREFIEVASASMKIWWRQTRKTFRLDIVGGKRVLLENKGMSTFEKSTNWRNITVLETVDARAEDLLLKKTRIDVNKRVPGLSVSKNVCVPECVAAKIQKTIDISFTTLDHYMIPTLGI